MKNTQKKYSTFSGVHFRFEQVYVSGVSSGSFFSLFRYLILRWLQSNWTESLNKPLQFCAVDAVCHGVGIRSYKMENCYDVSAGCMTFRFIFFSGKMYTHKCTLHRRRRLYTVIGTLNQFECRFHSNFGYVDCRIACAPFISSPPMSRLDFHQKLTITFRHTRTQSVSQTLLLPLSPLLLLGKILCIDILFK